MDERIGFVGIVLDDMSAAEKVNRVISEYQDMVTGRIGVPDHENGRAVIGLIVRGDSTRLGTFTGRLGNIAGVTVKSAVTRKNSSE
ncbi:MAG: CopG family transcriptional regulator [Clostridiales bacterium]|nr:CopG family transcriptional regulator [Clostridiales bacterium]